MFTGKIKILMFTMVSVMVLTLALPGTVFAQADDTPRVTVSGAGSVMAEPDIAMFSLGVSTSNSSAQEAIKENNGLMNQVIAAIKAFGIDEGDISTSQFSMHQMFHPTWDRFHIMEMGAENAYTVTNNITITARDLDTVGDVIGVGVAAGANMTGSVWFSVEDSSALYYEALALAIEDAAAKAQLMSRALNTSVTGIISVSEISGWSSPALTRGVALDSAAWRMHQSDWGVPIHSRYVEITARVEVVYSLAQ